MPKLSNAAPVSRTVTLLLVSIVVAACGGATSVASPSSSPVSSGPPPSSSPSASPSPSAPAVGAIDHKTGATDVLLRVEEGGGFVPMEINASQAPVFTLYGNGVIVFKQLAAMFPEPVDGVVHLPSWRTAKLDEDQVQELLDFALGAGGLGGARESYVDNTIADAPNTIFTVKAGGLDKTVMVSALFEVPNPGPDAVARTAFYKLSQRLHDFDHGGTIDSDVYAPERYRGVIFPRDPAPDVKPVAWPWPAIAPADFKEPPPDGSGPAFPHRVLTAEDVAALNLTGVEGGLQGPVLKGADGKLYTFILRPLLADEPE